MIFGRINSQPCSQDTDEDEEWRHRSDSDEPGDPFELDLDNLSRKILPKRQVAPSKFTPDVNDDVE